MKISKGLLLCIFFSMWIVGCSQEKPPFEAVYTSKNDVTVTYQGKKYMLNRYDPSVKTPFAYSFEDDGDLDLSFGDKHYEVDSPYDVDSKKKTTKKKNVSKKKTSKKQTRR